MPLYPVRVSPVRGDRHVSAVTPTASPDYHPERSEGSLSIGSEMLSAAKHDNAGALPCYRIALVFPFSELLREEVEGSSRLGLLLAGHIRHHLKNSAVHVLSSYEPAAGSATGVEVLTRLPN
jgi:hypothetical protein